jgi:hypothetical protein
MCFDVKSECTRKTFQECNMKGFSYQEQTQKEFIFWKKILDVIFFKYFKC